MPIQMHFLKLALLSTKLVYYLADRRSTLSGQAVNKRRLVSAECVTDI